ncbi:RND family transporter, partial [bacterium]
LFTILSLYWVSKLKLNMQMMDMMPKDEPQIVGYKNALDNFVGIDLIAVGIEGNKDEIIKYIENISPEIRKLQYVDKVISTSEIDFFKKHGFLLIKERDLDSMTGMLTASNLKDFVSGLNDNFEKEYIYGEDSDKISKDFREMLYLFNTIEDFLNTLKTPKPSNENIKEISDNFIVGPKYMISPDRTMGIMLIKTPITMTDIDRLVPFINNLEKLIKNNQQKFNVTAGLSGFLVLQRDEMSATQRDMKLSFSISIVLIIIIFLVGFRLLRYTILAVIPLILGIIWAMGLTYVFIGSLNTFTAMMGAILIGLGIDYAIHVISIYTEERQKGTSVLDAISMVYQKAVKGVITGAVTTAIGFMMFVLSSFPAFREFGITLGLGIICCLLASIFVLPSLLLIFGKKEVKKISRASSFFNFYKKIVVQRPWFVILIILIFVVLSFARFSEIKFSKDLKDIEPKGLESLEVNDRLIEKFDFSNDTTLGITKTIEQAHDLKDEAEDLDTIGLVESIATYIPRTREQKGRMEILKNIKSKVTKNVDSDLYLVELKEELYRLRDNIIEISDLAYIGGEHKIVKKADELINTKIVESVADNLEQFKNTIKNAQKIFIQNIKNIVLNSNSDRPIKPADLPENIRETYIGKDGTFLTIIYPEGDVWTNEFQPLYINEINSINMPLTGSSLLSIKVMKIAGKEGVRILLFVIATIFVVLIFDFLNIRYAIFAMMPMLFTLILLIGAMVWFGLKFDYVNIIALPIIIGIGVDDGVHLIHRYRIEKDLMATIKSTGRAILLTSLTTIAAFGTMIVSKYQGFVSFGKVLIFGIGWAYILTVFVLGSLIRLTERSKNK